MGTAQIAHDVIRLKSRLILDFFYPTNPQSDDMIVDDFKISGSYTTLNSNEVQELKQFVRRVNKWTIHLSWTRTEKPEYSKTDRELMEKYALDLLAMASKFIEECLSNGFQLGDLPNLYHDNLQRLHAHLIRTPRIEEGKGKRPARQICLEDLSP